MRTKRILFGILVLFAVLALSATGLHAAEQESNSVAVSSIGTLYGAGFGITDDFAVTDGCVVIGYDDGTAENTIAPKVLGVGMAVHFTVTDPDYVKLKTAGFALILNESVSDNSFDWEVLEWTDGAPGSVIASGTADPADHGLCAVDMGNIDIPKDFVIAMYSKQKYAPYLGCDENSSIQDRGLIYVDEEWSRSLEQNFMIRAVVCDNNGVVPDIDVTPVELEARLEPGESVSKTLNICNEGDGVLTYRSITISYDAPRMKTAAIGAANPEKIKKVVGTMDSISSTHEIAVSADEEIRYDDGEDDAGYYWPSAGPGMGVHFTVTNPDHKTLKTARFFIHMNDSVSSNSFDWKVLGWTGSMPGLEIASGTTTPAEDGWHDVDVGGITVSEDFVIAMYWRQGYAPALRYDSDPPIDKRSWNYRDTWSRWDGEDYMIRAVMGSGTPPPSGDEWLSVDETSGTVAPGDCDEIVVTIDATGLEPGRYSATIVISSDDSDEGTVTVPVTLDVVDKTTVDPPESAGNEVYFNPQRSIALNKTNEVDIRVNATNFRSGQLNITYPSEYANVTDWALNEDDFLRGLCTLTPGRAWITFVASGQLTGECTIGTLTIQRVEDACHTAELVFVEPSLLCNNSGQEIEVEWNNGIFTCDGVCGDVNEDGVVDMQDVTCLLDHVNLPFAYPICEWCGDVTGDGVIDIRDVTLLLNHADNQEGCPLCCM